MLQGSLKHLTPLTKLMILFLCSLIAMMTVSLIMLFVANTVLGIDTTSWDEIQTHLGFLKLMQCLQTVLVFIVPASIGFLLFYDKVELVFPGQKPLTLVFILIAIAIVIISQSFISWTAWLNQQLSFSEQWKWLGDWITQTEEQAKEMTSVMLQTSSYMQVLVTVLIIAVLPAFGEEIFFRGIIQRELRVLFKNPHIAIFITAFLFSAFHMQFLTFLPRLALGIILGYLMWYSQNLWVPITAHFVNNFMAVIIYIYYSKNELGETSLETNDSKISWFYATISLFLIILLILTSRKISQSHSKNQSKL